MFQPETEDMLPRAAPTPSSAAMTYETMGQPTVPEVSILFGQQQAQQQQQQQHQSASGTQSYAAWKKKMLPKVVFPASTVADGTAACIEAPRSTLYPLRTAVATISSSNSTAPQPAPATSTLYPLRTVVPTSSSNMTPLPEPSPALTALRSNLLQQQRRSLDAALAMPEVLTICAGTQTDNTGGIGGGAPFMAPENLATKDDIAQVLMLVQAMREEQQRVREMCEALLLQPPATPTVQRVQLREASTQSDACVDKAARRTETPPAPPLMQQYIAEENVEPATRAPVAQSTAYRPNTPQQQKQAPLKALANVLPKPATEKSMVMTELALKYLPNDKLTELMQELEVSPQFVASPPPALRGIENLVKSPTELSNASYKYLKKYRLLPEENCCHREAEYEAAPAQAKLASPRMPNGLQQDDGGAVARLEQLLDLERIRKQPKFL